MRAGLPSLPRRTSLAVFAAACGWFALAARRPAAVSPQHTASSLSSLSAPAMAAVALSAVERGAVVDRVRGALWGVHIADALSMPVHWCAILRHARVLLVLASPAPCAFVKVL
jgi:hypothetical protein